MPVLDAPIKSIAWSLLVSLMCESSNTVPTVTVNCLRHARHFRSPCRVLLPAFGVNRYGCLPPQCGHAGPLFPHRRNSMYSRALSSSVKCSPTFDQGRGVFSTH